MSAPRLLLLWIISTFAFGGAVQLSDPCSLSSPRLYCACTENDVAESMLVEMCPYWRQDGFRCFPCPSSLQTDIDCNACPDNRCPICWNHRFSLEKLYDDKRFRNGKFKKSVLFRISQNGFSYLKILSKNITSILNSPTAGKDIKNLWDAQDNLNSVDNDTYSLNMLLQSQDSLSKIDVSRYLKVLKFGNLVFKPLKDTSGKIKKISLKVSQKHLNQPSIMDSGNNFRSEKFHERLSSLIANRSINGILSRFTKLSSGQGYVFSFILCRIPEMCANMTEPEPGRFEVRKKPEVMENMDGEIGIMLKQSSITPKDSNGDSDLNDYKLKSTTRNYSGFNQSPEKGGVIRFLLSADGKSISELAIKDPENYTALIGMSNSRNNLNMDKCLIKGIYCLHDAKDHSLLAMIAFQCLAFTSEPNSPGKIRMADFDDNSGLVKTPPNCSIDIYFKKENLRAMKKHGKYFSDCNIPLSSDVLMLSVRNSIERKLKSELIYKLLETLPTLRLLMFEMKKNNSYQLVFPIYIFPKMAKEISYNNEHEMKMKPGENRNSNRHKYPLIVKYYKFSDRISEKKNTFNFDSRRLNMFDVSCFTCELLDELMSHSGSTKTEDATVAISLSKLSENISNVSMNDAGNSQAGNVSNEKKSPTFSSEDMGIASSKESMQEHYHAKSRNVRSMGGFLIRGFRNSQVDVDIAGDDETSTKSTLGLTILGNFTLAENNFGGVMKISRKRNNTANNFPARANVTTIRSGKFSEGDSITMNKSGGTEVEDFINSEHLLTTEVPSQDNFGIFRKLDIDTRQNIQKFQEGVANNSQNVQENIATTSNSESVPKEDVIRSGNLEHSSVKAKDSGGNKSGRNFQYGTDSSILKEINDTSDSENYSAEGIARFQNLNFFQKTDVHFKNNSESFTRASSGAENLRYLTTSSEGKAQKDYDVKRNASIKIDSEKNPAMKFIIRNNSRSIPDVGVTATKFSASTPSDSENSSLSQKDMDSFRHYATVMNKFRKNFEDDVNSEKLPEEEMGKLENSSSEEKFAITHESVSTFQDYNDDISRDFGTNRNSGNFPGRNFAGFHNLKIDADDVPDSSENVTLHNFYSQDNSKNSTNVNENNSQRNDDDFRDGLRKSLIGVTTNSTHTSTNSGRFSTVESAAMRTSGNIQTIYANNKENLGKLSTFIPDNSGNLTAAVTDFKGSERMFRKNFDAISEERKFPINYSDSRNISGNFREVLATDIPEAKTASVVKLTDFTHLETEGMKEMYSSIPHEKSEVSDHNSEGFTRKNHYGSTVGSYKMTSDYAFNKSMDGIQAFRKEVSTDRSERQKMMPKRFFSRRRLLRFEETEDNKEILRFSINDSDMKHRSKRGLPHNSWCCIDVKPRYGNMECTIWTYKKLCKLVCFEGYSVNGQNSMQFCCTRKQNKWTPEFAGCKSSSDSKISYSQPKTKPPETGDYYDETLLDPPKKGQPKKNPPDPGEYYDETLLYPDKKGNEKTKGKSSKKTKEVLKAGYHNLPGSVVQVAKEDVKVQPTPAEYVEYFDEDQQILKEDSNVGEKSQVDNNSAGEPNYADNLASVNPYYYYDREE